ncbi:MAG: phosphodiester glycosidase family protein, partial [Acidimicrobiales bacterium]
MFPTPSTRRRPATLGLAAALTIVLVAAGAPLAPAAADELEPYADPVPHATGYHVTSSTEPTPGIEYLRLQRDSPQAEVHALRLAPSVLPRLEIVTASDHQARTPTRETTTSMCRRVRCVAAINGDYYHLADGLPAGPVVTDGELRFGIGDITHGAVLIDGGRRFSAVTTDELTWTVTVQTGAEVDLTLDRVNRSIRDGGTALYTSRYGPSTGTPAGTLEITARLADGADHPVGQAPLEIVDRSTDGDSPIPDGHVVIAARGDRTHDLELMWAQGATDLASAILTVDVGPTHHAIGGSPVLMRNGRYHFPWEDPAPATQGRRPRTIIGWTPAGEVLLVTVDGDRPGYSVGVNLPEAARLLARLGAVEGVMLDGGASSTMVIGGQIRNRPTGGERAVGGAVVVLSEWGRNISTASARDIDPACPDPVVPASTFDDLGTANPHAPAVDCVAWWEITQGVTPLRYAPTGVVTRGQMATFLVRFLEASGTTVADTAPAAFPDTAGHSHAPNIDRLAAMGIVGGFSDGLYRPDAPVTRAQMASFIARTWEHRIG